MPLTGRPVPAVAARLPWLRPFGCPCGVALFPDTATQGGFVQSHIRCNVICLCKMLLAVQPPSIAVRENGLSASEARRGETRTSSLAHETWMSNKPALLSTIHFTERLAIAGCHFFWVLFFGQAKKSTSPEVGRNRPSRYEVASEKKKKLHIEVMTKEKSQKQPKRQLNYFPADV